MQFATIKCEADLQCEHGELLNKCKGKDFIIGTRICSYFCASLEQWVKVQGRAE